MESLGKWEYCFKISTTKQICKLLMISLADVATARVMSRCSKSPPADSPLLQHWPDVETMERACGINWNNVFSCFFKWQTTRGAPNNVVVGTKQKNVANHCRPPRPPDQPSNGTIITAGFVDLSDGWLACYQLINTLKPRLAKGRGERAPRGCVRGL